MIPVITLYAVRADHIADGRRMCPVQGPVALGAAMASHDPGQIYRGQWCDQGPPYDEDSRYCGIVECELVEGVEVDDPWYAEAVLCERHQAPDREDEEA